VIDELTGQEEIVVKTYDAVRDGLPFFGGGDAALAMATLAHRRREQPSLRKPWTTC
jgi:hypothetical protein